MKQTISLAIALMLAFSGVFAKTNETATKQATAKSDNISVTYGQPTKNGRVIFGNPTDNAVIPYGTVWCTGEGMATEVTFKKDCKVGGNRMALKAGTYTLFTKPAHGEWIFIFNSQLKQHGSADYEKNKTKNVVETWALNKKLESAVEKFTITPKTDGLLMEWDNVSVMLPVEFSN